MTTSRHLQWLWSPGGLRIAVSALVRWAWWSVEVTKSVAVRGTRSLGLVAWLLRCVGSVGGLCTLLLFPLVAGILGHPKTESSLRCGRENAIHLGLGDNIAKLPARVESTPALTDNLGICSCFL